MEKKRGELRTPFFKNDPFSVEKLYADKEIYPQYIFRYEKQNTELDVSYVTIGG